MIEKGFVAHAGGRYFRAKENAVIWATVIDSPTFDLLFRECVIVGAELIDAPVVEGIIYVLRQNFGRYLIVIIDHDYDNEENDLALAVWVAEAEETTASGLFIAASAQEKPEFMTVAAVGPGTDENPMTVKVGDKVIITKYSGTDVKVDGDEYTIASVKDILAVIE